MVALKNGFQIIINNIKLIITKKKSSNSKGSGRQLSISHQSTFIYILVNTC